MFVWCYKFDEEEGVVEFVKVKKKTCLQFTTQLNFGDNLKMQRCQVGKYDIL